MKAFLLSSTVVGLIYEKRSLAKHSQSHGVCVMRDVRANRKFQQFNIISWIRCNLNKTRLLVSCTFPAIMAAILWMAPHLCKKPGGDGWNQGYGRAIKRRQWWPQVSSRARSLWDDAWSHQGGLGSVPPKQFFIHISAKPSLYQATEIKYQLYDIFVNLVPNPVEHSRSWEADSHFFNKMFLYFRKPEDLFLCLQETLRVGPNPYILAHWRQSSSK